MSIPRVIIVIASSLDGRIAFPGGGESHLGSEEDKKMLNQNLSMVDATIFGLGTLTVSYTHLTLPTKSGV